MQRRDLLKAAALFPMLTVGGRLYAAPATDTRLLIVFLRGGYDAANVVIPAGSDFYHQSRPTIAVPKPGDDPKASVALDGDWALHPALKDTIYPLYQKKEAAFIAFAGTNDATRSHFETQDFIERGQKPAGTRDFRTGFMNRLAGVLDAPRPIAFTSQLPLSFHGDLAVPNIAPERAGRPNIDAKSTALIEAMYKDSELAPAVQEGFKVQDEVYRVVSAEMQSANRNAVSTKGFELAAHRIGMLMRDTFNLGFVDIGGWDTHVNQGGADGYLATRLGELGRGLASFAA